MLVIHYYCGETRDRSADATLQSLYLWILTSLEKRVLILEILFDFCTIRLLIMLQKREVWAPMLVPCNGGAQ